MRRELLILTLVLSVGCNEIIDTGRFEVRDGAVSRDGGGMDGGDAGGGGMDGGDAGGGVDACESNLWYRDSDSDTYGNPSMTRMGCDQPAGYVANADDCDDSTDTVAPGVTETCDDVDQDCDGAVDEGLMGPIGAPIQLDSMACCLDFHPVVAGHSNGFLVGWENPTDYRLRYVEVPATGAPPAATVGAAPAGSWVGQRARSAVRHSDPIVGEAVVVIWSEAGIRAQIFPTDGSPPLAPFFVTDAEDATNHTLASVGNRVVVFWQQSGTTNTIFARAIDPALSAPVGTAPTATDLTGTGSGTPVLVSALGVGSSPPRALVSLFWLGSTTVGSQLITFGLVSEPSWLGASATTDANPFLGTFGGYLSGPSAALPDEPSILGVFVGSDGPAPPTGCYASITPVGSSGAPEVGPCEPLAVQPTGVSYRDGLVSTLVTRGMTRLSLIEFPISPPASGSTLIDLVDRRSPDGQASLAMFGSAGLLLYGDEDATGSSHLLLAQRIGCMP